LLLKKAERRFRLRTSDYARLAAFRAAVREFLRFSEDAAAAAGLTAQHYQAMLALRASPARRLTINDLAQQLLIRHNSAVGLVDRLSRHKLAARQPSPLDRREVHLRLTAKGDKVLGRLAAVHHEELRRSAPRLRRQLRRIAA
jgi:DNA-binding MarR family transcriptional regulator